MSPEEMVKRLDRFESTLDDGMAKIQTDVRDICILVRVHDRQLIELHQTIAELRINQRKQSERCDARQITCPAADVSGFKKWLWATIGACLAALAATWAKIGMMADKIGGGQ